MDATGKFTLSITDGVAPCVLRAVTPSTPGPSQTMYSVALAAGTVNVSPITHAVADAAATTLGTNIASAFNNWNTSFTPSTLTASGLTTAKTTMRNYLVAAGFTVSTVGDFLTETFNPDSNNPHDILLDAIKATQVPLAVLIARAKGQVQLPDTGQVLCYNTTGPTIACAGTGQDGALGLDVDTASNTNDDGTKGFSYLKLDSTGKPIAVTATTWDCVRDNITGLVWENKVVATNTTHLRSSAHRYTWYSTDTANNGSNTGSTGSNTCSATLTGSLCNTQAYVAAVNAAALCGKTDWRLPTREELRSIVNYGTYNPAIDASYFANTQSDWHWSSSSLADIPSGAWGVNFNYGGGSYDNKTGSYYVRLVRSSQ
jgi:hypothetical protein